MTCKAQTARGSIFRTRYDLSVISKTPHKVTMISVFGTKFCSLPRYVSE